jgi:hypothetical protein
MGSSHRERKVDAEGNVIGRRPDNDDSDGGGYLALTTRFNIADRSIPYFRICDQRSTCATWPSAGGVAEEWVTQLLNAKVFKKYSEMKLQMKREGMFKLNRHANEQRIGLDTVRVN